MGYITEAQQIFQMTHTEGNSNNTWNINSRVFVSLIPRKKLRQADYRTWKVGSRRWAPARLLNNGG